MVDEDRDIGSPVVPEARPVDAHLPFARPVAAPSTQTRMRPDEMRLEDSSRARALFDIVFLIVAIMAADLLFGAVLAAVLTEEPDMRALLVPVVGFRTVTATALVGLVLFFRRQGSPSVGLTRESLGLNIPLGVASMIAAYAIIYPTMLALASVAEGAWENMAENVERLTQMVPRMSPFAFALVALAVGYYEELFFRGFLMTRLRRATGSWWIAVALSTIAFTAPHALDQTWTALIPVAILSLVFSAVTIWRRSLIPAIVGHTLFNLSQYLGLYFSHQENWA